MRSSATIEARLRDFFDEYAARFNRALAIPPQTDVEATAAAFAEYVVGASPQGVRGSTNDEEFRAAIPRSMELYRSVGTTSMRIAGLELTLLDGMHSMARVHWDSRYRRPSDGADEAIEFDVVYLVQHLEGGTPQVFAYITGDEQQVLRAHGLLPANTEAGAGS